MAGALIEIPSWLASLWSLILGLVIGSFVNVLIVRLPHGKSLIKPGSECPQCRKPVRWWDNIPVLSYLILRGHCRSCHASISFRYPVVELLTGILFLAARFHEGWTPVLFFRDFPFIAILVAITFIDLEHRIIPDVLSLGGLALGLITGWADPHITWVQSCVGALCGFGFFYSMAWIYERYSGHSGLGGGDIKLLAMIGAFVGFSGVFATVFISSIFGSFVGIVWALVARKKNVMKMAIPYGPFLVVGALYYYLLGDYLWFQFMTPM